MIVLIRRKTLFLTLLLVLFFGGMWTVLREGSSVAAAASAALRAIPTVVVDAGHGGEDGGAVAGDGTVESGINLAIARRLNDLLRFCGISTRMTRSSDSAVYSEGAGSLHEKKVSDLKNRVALVNQTPEAILVSVHQNCLPSAPSVHGAQVFCNAADGADALAESVQGALNSTVNAGNEKKSKQIASSIYLMKKVTAPAVLVECGFLSNAEETQLLQQSGYQIRLAAAITSGVMLHT